MCGQRAGVVGRPGDDKKGDKGGGGGGGGGGRRTIFFLVSTYSSKPLPLYFLGCHSTVCLCVRFSVCFLGISFHSAFSPLGLFWLYTTLFWDRSVDCRSQSLCTVLQDYKNSIQSLPSCNYVLQNALNIFVLKLCVLLGPLPAGGLPLIILTGLRVVLQRNLMSQSVW